MTIPATKVEYPVTVGKVPDPLPHCPKCGSKVDVVSDSELDEMHVRVPKDRMRRCPYCKMVFKTECYISVTRLVKLNSVV